MKKNNRDVSKEAAAGKQPVVTKPVRPATPPSLPAATPALKKPYVHPETMQTVYHEAKGWAFTATGIAIAPLPEAPNKAE